MSEMSETIQRYAGFWRRFAAYMLDSFVISWALNEFYWSVFNQMRSMAATTKSHNLRLENMESYASIGIWLMTIPFVWVYYSGMESSPLRATIGKLAVGIYVTDLQGQRISFGQATGRFFGKLLSSAFLAIGYLMAGLTEKKQALHDSMAGCLVLRK